MSVKHIFLALLTVEDLHGYDLKQRYDSLLLHESELNFGQVYSTLNRLERDGFIALLGNPESEKKVYTITPLGRGELTRWLVSPGKESMVLYDELSYKLAAMDILSQKEFFQILQAYKKQLVKEMQLLTKKKLTLPQGHLGAKLLLDRGILKLEADISWTEKCLELLEKEGDAVC